MLKRLLPIGIRSFRKLRERSCYYMDKTGYALRLTEEGTRYFLSRPRRFGKSLFLDTLKELFEGSRELFEGLHAYDRWDWSVRYPVVKLSFGQGNFKEPGHLHTNLMAQLEAIEDESAVKKRHETGPERLAHLLRMLHDGNVRRVAVLGGRVRQANSGCSGGGRCRASQSRLAARAVLHNQGLRRARPILFPNRGEQLLQGEPFLGTQQSHRHHS